LLHHVGEGFRPYGGEEHDVGTTFRDQPWQIFTFVRPGLADHTTVHRCLHRTDDADAHIQATLADATHQLADDLNALVVTNLADDAEVQHLRLTRLHG